MKILPMAAMVVAAAATMAFSACNNSAQVPSDPEGILPHGITMLSFDSVSLMTIQDNAEERRMPNTLFYGKNDSNTVKRLSPEGSVASSVSCFLIERDGKKALFDTGNGVARGGRMNALLDSMGISTDAIDYIFITHLHGDHIGGLTNNGKAVFARAKVYVAEDEYGFWMGDRRRMKKEYRDAADGVAAVLGAYEGRISKFAYGSRLPLGVTAMKAHGHTPGHTVYGIGRLLIVGDLMHGYDLQIQDPTLCASFDMDTTEAIATRRQFIDYAKKHNLVVAGMHLPRNGVVEQLP